MFSYALLSPSSQRQVETHYWFQALNATVMCFLRSHWRCAVADGSRLVCHVALGWPTRETYQQQHMYCQAGWNKHAIDSASQRRARAVAGSSEWNGTFSVVCFFLRKAVLKLLGCLYCVLCNLRSCVSAKLARSSKSRGEPTLYWINHNVLRFRQMTARHDLYADALKASTSLDYKPDIVKEK